MTERMGKPPLSKLSKQSEPVVLAMFDQVSEKEVSVLKIEKPD